MNRFSHSILSTTSYYRINPQYDFDRDDKNACRYSIHILPASSCSDFLSPRMPNTIPQLPNLHCKRPFLLIQTMVKKEERVSQTRPGGKNKKHRSNPSTSHHQVRLSTQHHIHNFVNFVRSSPPTRLPLALLTIRSCVDCMRGYC